MPVAVPVAVLVPVPVPAAAVAAEERQFEVDCILPVLVNTESTLIASSH